jgi:heme-degrading monooxygenase HmoA
MAFMMLQFEVEDFDAWKQVFDSDPAGRKGVAKGHKIFRGVDDPNQVFVSTEYDSAEDAKAVRERLLASGALDDFTVKTPPTVTELADSAEY